MAFRYGFLLKFRFAPMMPNQLYRFDPATGNVRVVATDFVRPNGVAFTPDGTVAYVYVPRLVYRNVAVEFILFSVPTLAR